MKYRKKPIEVEVFHWTNPRTDDPFTFMGGACRLTQEKGQPRLAIPTLEGVMYASVGDWIIKGVNGEFYPCKPEIFEKTYESVEQ